MSVTNGITIKLYIQTKATRDQIIGLHNNEVKVTITAQPIANKANAHLINFLSKQFGVAKGKIIIEKGITGRHKQLRIIHPQQIPEIIAALYIT